jgi:hypothetical protein
MSSPEAAMRGGADAGLEVGNAPRDYGTGCLWSIPSDTSDRSSVDLYTRISRMNDILFVRIGRICHEHQDVALVMVVGSWNTQRVNRMMALCESISTAA